MFCDDRHFLLCLDILKEKWLRAKCSCSSSFIHASINNSSHVVRRVDKKWMQDKGSIAYQLNNEIGPSVSAFYLLVSVVRAQLILYCSLILSLFHA